MNTRVAFRNNDLGTILSNADENTPSDEAAYSKLLQREKKESIKGKAQDRKQRKSFASKIYWLTIAWLCVIGFMLIFQGFLGPLGCFHLSDRVLITLISGASINIIGLMAIVIRYLFPSQRK